YPFAGHPHRTGYTSSSARLKPEHRRHGGRKHRGHRAASREYLGLRDPGGRRLRLRSRQLAARCLLRFQAFSYALDCAWQVPLDQIFIVHARPDECPLPRVRQAEFQWLDLFPEWDRGMSLLKAMMRAVPSVSPLACALTNWRGPRPVFDAGQIA